MEAVSQQVGNSPCQFFSLAASLPGDYDNALPNMTNGLPPDPSLYYFALP
jgi:hypothetical protein